MNFDHIKDPLTPAKMNEDKYLLDGSLGSDLMVMSAVDGLLCTHSSAIITAVAVEYAIGRSSYVPGCVVDWLILNWDGLSEKVKRFVRCRVDEAIAEHGLMYAPGYERNRLGDCEADWKRLQDLWAVQDGII